MSFELGQKVSFTKSLSRQMGNSIIYDDLTDDQRNEVDDGGHIELLRFKEREHNKKIGFIGGKRNITVSVYLADGGDEYGGPGLIPIEHKTEDVFVVACDMQRMFRVRKEDLEVVTHAE